jgi:AcrR family transcriptional regulator
MPREQRQQLILDIAGRVFAQDGYHSASMDRIAALAGVSKPMLYTYFGSKEGLYVAYIERSGQELVERLRRAFAADDPGSRLRVRVSEFLSFVEEHGDGWKVLFSEASASQPVAEQVSALRARIVDAVAAAVKTDVGPAPALTPAVVDGLAHAIVGAGESLANWWLEHLEVRREEVARWYGAVIRGSVAALIGERGGQARR